MKLTLVNIYPRDTVARYLLSGYVLKGYLKKYYKTGALEIDVLNFNENAGIEDIREKLAERKPDIIGYSCYIWNVEKILKLISQVRGSIKGAIHVLGGPEISAQRVASLDDPAIADYYIIGEGEKQLLSLIEYIRSKKSGDGLKYPADHTENVAELDEIPSIYLDGVIEDNLYEKQQVFLETQRGCRYKCKYCVYHRMASSLRYYSKERVIRELDHLIVDKRVTAVRIIDPIFTSDLPRAKEIVRHLVDLKGRAGIRLPWVYWEFDQYSVDEEFIRLTASLKYRDRIANTDEIPALDRPQLYSDMLKDYIVINSIGIESFFEPALQAVGRRRVDLGKFDAFMKMVNAHNVVLKLDLILGLPFETVETYFKGLETLLPYFKKTDHVLNIHRLQILPGSELESLTGEYGIEYSRRAPHIVSRTNTISVPEMEFASKLSAVLSRIVNSPVRSLFFESWARSGEGLEAFTKKLYSQLQSLDNISATPLVKDAAVDDLYWNDRIYRDIPSQVIAGLLKN